MSDKSFYACGSVKLFADLGLESFLVDLPKECYPDYEQEFYGNLTMDKFGNYVSFVQDKKITLNMPVLNSILRIKSASSMYVFTKKGPFVFEDFSKLDQLRLCRGIPGILEFHYPTTSTVTPMTHLLFKVCIANICPQLGSRSNFSCQDFLVVAMLLSGRQFNLSELILKNMMVVYEGNQSTGLPYGCLLTRIFDWYDVELKNCDKYVVKEFLDNRSLA